MKKYLLSIMILTFCGILKSQSIARSIIGSHQNSYTINNFHIQSALLNNLISNQNSLIQTPFLQINPVSKKPSLIIYPNPTSNYINCVMDSKLAIKKVKIMDQNGKIISEFKGSKVSLNSFSSGVYYIQATDTDNKVESSQIVLIK